MNFIRKHVVAKSALDALSPLIFFTMFAGISPYRVVSDKGNIRSFISTPYALLISFIVRLVYVVCIVFAVSSGDTVVELFNDVPFIRFSEHLRIYIEVMFMLCLFVTIFKQKDNCRRKVEALSDIDKDLALIGVTKDYTDLKIFHIFVGCLFQVIHGVHSSLSVFYFAHWGKKPYSSYALVVTTGFPTYFATVISMMFVRIVAMSKQNLKEINKELTKMLQKMQEITPKLKYESKMNNLNLNIRNKMMTKRLTSLIKTYCKVCDLSKEMSNDFGAQILIIVSMAFIFMVINTFLFMNILSTMVCKEEFTSRKIFFLGYCVHTFVIHAINMSTLTKACDNCENEVSIRMLNSFI